MLVVDRLDVALQRSSQTLPGRLPFLWIVALGGRGPVPLEVLILLHPDVLGVGEALLGARVSRVPRHPRSDQMEGKPTGVLRIQEREVEADEAPAVGVLHDHGQSHPPADHLWAHRTAVSPVHSGQAVPVEPVWAGSRVGLQPLHGLLLELVGRQQLGEVLTAGSHGLEHAGSNRNILLCGTGRSKGLNGLLRCQRGEPLGR